MKESFSPSLVTLLFLIGLSLFNMNRMQAKWGKPKKPLFQKIGNVIAFGDRVVEVAEKPIEKKPSA